METACEENCASEQEPATANKLAQRAVILLIPGCEPGVSSSLGEQPAPQAIPRVQVNPESKSEESEATKFAGRVG